MQIFDDLLQSPKVPKWSTFILVCNFSLLHFFLLQINKKYHSYISFFSPKAFIFAYTCIQDFRVRKFSILTWFGLFAFRVKGGSLDFPCRNSARLLFHCRCGIWPQKAVELQVEFQTVWYIFDEQVECIWKSLDTNVEKVVESAKDTKRSRIRPQNK